ncbi:MAG: carbon storage regulator [Sandaracinaceae bacterium]
MLTLTRRAGQTILLGPDIQITVVSVAGGRVRLGIRAPRSVPVHRLELVERVAEENRAALARSVEEGVAAGAQIAFPEGLFGLRDHDAWLLCDFDVESPIRCLVSCRDPEVQLLVVDAETAWPGYPLDAARAAFGSDEETAVALIVTVPADGSSARANLLAPLVIGLESREGRQVMVERPGLEVAAPIGAAVPGRKAG